MFASKVLSSKDAFFFGFVGQHSPSDYITNSQDPWYVGLKMVIHDNSAPFINLYSCFFESQLVSVRLSACCYQNVVSPQHLLFSSFYRLNRDFCVCPMVDSPCDFVRSEDFDALLC